MLELGENSLRFHYEVGSALADQAPEILVCIGERAGEIGRGLSEQGDGHTKIRYFKDNQTALEYLKTEIKAGDLVLFKGSNSMHLGELVTALREA